MAFLFSASCVAWEPLLLFSCLCYSLVPGYSVEQAGGTASPVYVRHSWGWHWAPFTMAHVFARPIGFIYWSNDVAILRTFSSLLLALHGSPCYYSHAFVILWCGVILHSKPAVLQARYAYDIRGAGIGLHSEWLMCLPDPSDLFIYTNSYDL